MKYLLSAFSFLLFAFSFSAKAQMDFSDVPYLAIAAKPVGGSSFTDITNGLLAWYPLANDARDHFGLNDGTMVGSPSFTTGPTGLANTAISLDGSSQWVTVTTNLNPTNLTITAWVNASSLAHNPSGVFIKQRSSPDRYSAFMINSSGKIAIYQTLLDSTTKFYDGSGSHTLSIGTWYFLAYTYDPTSGLIGYVNASSDGTDSPGIGADAGSSALAIIGASPVTSGREFNGSIAGVRIYGRALSSTEITTLYNNGLNGNIF